MPWIKCLGGGGSKARRGKSLTVSQPVHLLVKSEFEPQCHVFRTKQLRRSRPCHLCHQSIIKQASCCRVCKYTCHKTCEDKGARFRDTSQQIHKQWQADPARAFPSVGGVVGNLQTSQRIVGSSDISSSNSTSSPSPSPTSNGHQITHNGSYEAQPNGRSSIGMAGGKHYQVQKAPSATISRTPGVGADATCTGKSGGRVSEIMELCYVTERIIALWYREDAQGVLEHATTLLRGKHADNYMIFNLSSPGRNGESNTREVGWPQGLAPSLERLCALCKELDSWLNAAPNRVVVLHARGGKERLGVAVSAYMNYSSICGGRDQALDRFAMRRFLDDKIGHLHVPSHRRYVEYFSGLLAGSLRISPSPLYLTHVTVLGVPLFEPTGCRAFLKVYEGLTPVYTSDLYSVTNAREFTINLGGLRLRGDILVKCYHRVYSKQSREVMFSLQFHTCVITENVVSFPRSELDVACQDPRCPTDGVVTLYFATDARRQDGPIPAPTPAVPHASAHHDPILHWDSYTNLENSDDEGRETPLSPPPPSSSSVRTSPRGLGYTCGPIDGSLYAVVNQGAGSGARGSPLTVSMDSGISSAPPQRPSPPEPEPESQAHGDLDKLLHDMMLTVESMPDPPSSEEYNRLNRRSDKMYIHESRGYGNSNPASNYSSVKESNYRNYGSSKRDTSPSHNTSTNNYGSLKNETRNMDIVDYRISTDRKNHDSISSNPKQNQSFSPSGNIDFIDEDIPYHARQTSQPFSYGATSDMIKHQKLSSPSLVRKATMRATTNPVVDIDDILADNSRRPISPLSPHTPDPPPEFANGSAKLNSDHADGLSWLRQQQLKLAARRDERSPGKMWRQESGNRVIGELRSLQRGRLRHDGYASDSAVLDDDDELWTTNTISYQQSSKGVPHTSAPASPLLPQRSSSRKFNGGMMNGTLGRPRAESVNERPFVSVKRAYEFQKYSDGQSPQTSPNGAQKTAQQLGVGQQQSLNSRGIVEKQQQQQQQQQQEEITNRGRQQQQQPPRPDSRSDSYGRTETLLREHRQNSSSLTPCLNNLQENTTAQRFTTHPESRNDGQAVTGNFETTKNYYSDHTINQDAKDNETGLLAVVEQKTSRESNDPLVSLMRSLAEMSPVKKSILTNKNENNNHLQFHHHHHSISTPSSTTYNSDTNTDTNSSPNQSPKAWQCSTQPPQNDSPSSWIERSASPGSAGVGNASRPQTPAFPVHPRTPYVNNSSPTVTFAADRNYVVSNNINHDTSTYAINNNNIHNADSHVGNNINNNNIRGYVADRAIYIEERRDINRETGLPPKSPTTQRRLSFPASGTLKQMHNKRWPLTNQSASFDYSKDRPVSPTSDSTISETHTVIRHTGTPTQVDFTQSPKSATSYSSVNSGGHSSPQVQHYGSRRSSIHSNTEPQEVADVNVKFVRDTSRIWYKPNISREQAISMLKDATPGTFVVRDSNSFPGAFGLALKVATPPPGAPSSPKDPSSELVRHFLIEPTSRGVRLKGCANEPVFSSLSALVYQHSLMAMALPCQLLLPEPEAAARALDSPSSNSTQQLLAQGAACNVLYLFTIDTESLTGPQAIKKSITTLFEQKPLPTATIVHFKVSTQGITLTDNARKLFFRRHYPTNNISYCGLDTEERTWDFVSDDTGRPLSAHRCFGFVARKPAHKTDNQCHVFAELELGQPATAIVNFVNKVMMGSAAIKANIV